MISTIKADYKNGLSESNSTSAPVSETGSWSRKRGHEAQATGLKATVTISEEDQTSIMLSLEDLCHHTKIRRKDLEFYLRNSDDFPKGLEVNENTHQVTKLQIIVNISKEIDVGFYLDEVNIDYPV